MITDAARAATRRRGVTSLGLTASMALCVLAFTLAVPTLRGYLADTQARTAATDMLSTLAYARTEAIRRKREVRVCVSANGETCTPGVGWDAGWVVLAGGTLLRTHAAVTEVCQIATTPAVNNAIAFAPDGRAAVEGAAVFNLRGCLRGARADRLISVAGSGRASISKSNCP